MLGILLAAGCAESPAPEPERFVPVEVVHLRTGADGPVTVSAGGVELFRGTFGEAGPDGDVRVGPGTFVRFRAADGSGVLADADFSLEGLATGTLYVFGDADGQGERVPSLVLRERITRLPADPRQLRLVFAHALAGLDSAVDVRLDGVLRWEALNFREFGLPREVDPPEAIRVTGSEGEVLSLDDLDLPPGTTHELLLVHDADSPTAPPSLRIRQPAP